MFSKRIEYSFFLILKQLCYKILFGFPSFFFKQKYKGSQSLLCTPDAMIEAQIYTIAATVRR